MTNVIAFERPKASTKAQPQRKPSAKRTPGLMRSQWLAGLAAIWANPKNWKGSKRGNAFIVIDDIGVCVVIHRKEGGFQWEIRWRNRDEPIVSRWIFIIEQAAIDDAWSAVTTVG